MSSPDYYEILQVSPKADPDVIRAAYRRLIAKYHPDVNKSPDAEGQAKRISEAFSTLNDPARRAAYDAARAAEARSNIHMAGGDEEISIHHVVEEEIIELRTEDLEDESLAPPSASCDSLLEVTLEDAQVFPPLPDEFTTEEAKDAGQWIRVDARCQESGEPFLMWFRERADGDFEVAHTQLLPAGHGSTGSRRRTREIHGRVYLGRYKGCPVCGAKSFYKCNACRGIVCFSGDRETLVTCPNCRDQGYVTGYIKSIEGHKRGKKNLGI